MRMKKFILLLSLNAFLLLAKANETITIIKDGNSIEFIAIDFVIMSTGASFDD